MQVKVFAANKWVRSFIEIMQVESACEPIFSELKEEGIFTVSLSAAFYTECGYVEIWNAADFTEKMFILFQTRLTYSLISFRETF